MRSWLRHHWQSLTGAVRRLLRHPIASLANVLVIGIAAALPIAGYVLVGNIQQLAGGVPTDPQMSVFMALEAGQADLRRVEGKLQKAAGILRSEFVSKDQALARLREREGFGEAIGVLKTNPLPDAFVVYLDRSQVEAAESLAKELRELPNVAHVQLDAAWLRRLEGIVRFAQIALWGVGGVLALALVAVIFNTIRLQLLSRLDEIVAARFVGATDAYIRRPFCYYGALLGLLGGAVGLGMSRLAVGLLDREVGTLASHFGAPFKLGFLPPESVLAIAAVTLVLGLLGAYLSVSVHLRKLRLG